MRRAARLTALIAIVSIFGLTGCGDSPTQPPPPPPPPPTPSATIQATGNGAIVIGPSIDPTFCCSTVFPITIQETSGGTAIWNFFRVSYLLNGVEVERAEVGSDIIAAAGFREIAARSTNEASVLVRDNATDFDDVRILLGFADTKDGRQIERMLNIASFSGIVINPIPSVIPGGGTAAVVPTSGE